MANPNYLNHRVRKAIIPAAGLGTRFLPATKSMAKEMFPIVDTPNIQFIVEEAIKSGIEDILIITNQNKVSIENHFDINYELETRLKEQNKPELARLIHQIGSLVNIHYIRQKEPKGLGDAILCAQTFVNDEPFAVLLGDDLIINNQQPALLQLLDVYEAKKCSVLGVQKVPHADVSKYGIVEPSEHCNVDNKKNRFNVVHVNEKPSLEEAKSDFAILGRYILTPTIFDMLRKIPLGKNGELQLTDAINALGQSESIWACVFSGQRYDIGDKLGYLKANIDFALKRSELQSGLEDYILELAKQIEKNKK